eukprot:CAMPEP_0180170068 /NCGR_PEP_ID=MMETSP0986-20121125/33619_1 /TAXON_ID=697907 /ORGANISM="non described non described, Strain CCMP2293" /LENGTH=72 /DNA_ID=CAMNT_0022121713 /DNA_START=33 /DNA_END=247 /DNA_ORIENTATION=+
MLITAPNPLPDFSALALSRRMRQTFLTQNAMRVAASARPSSISFRAAARTLLLSSLARSSLTSSASATTRCT